MRLFSRNVDTGVDSAARKVDTASAMATDKTKSVSGRVPVEVAEALERDALELGLKPGSLLRQLLEGRYSAPARARKADRQAAKEDSEMDLVMLLES
jgi:hypothetical protein